MTKRKKKPKLALVVPLECPDNENYAKQALDKMMRTQTGDTEVLMALVVTKTPCSKRQGHSHTSFAAQLLPELECTEKMDVVEQSTAGARFLSQMLLAQVNLCDEHFPLAESFQTKMAESVKTVAEKLAKKDTKAPTSK